MSDVRRSAAVSARKEDFTSSVVARLVSVGAKVRFASVAISSLPPCGEGMGVGVVRWGAAVPYCTTPHPIPPPQEGRESLATRTNLNLAPVGLDSAAYLGGGHE